MVMFIYYTGKEQKAEAVGKQALIQWTNLHFQPQLYRWQFGKICSTLPCPYTGANNLTSKNLCL